MKKWKNDSFSPVHPRVFWTRIDSLQKLYDRKPMAIERFKMEETDA